MKKPILFIFLTISLMFAAIPISAQGKDFWVSLNDGYYSPGLYLTIVSEKACEVKIENPNAPWNRITVQLEANSYKYISMRRDLICINEHNRPITKGYLVSSSENINVYMYSLHGLYSEALAFYPESLLSDEYIIQNYPAYEWANMSEKGFQHFLVLATEDNTEIDIFPTDTVYELASAFSPFSIQLNKGQVFKVYTNNEDLSGTHIKARENKKIAVYAGLEHISVPRPYGGTDLGFEQILPLSEWGKEFIIIRTYEQGANRIRITASTDNTDIFKDGIRIETIQAYETYELEITYPEEAYHIQTSQPCLIQQYMVGAGYSEEINRLETGDPSIVNVPSLNKTMKKVNFAVLPKLLMDSYGIHEEYISIVAKTDELRSMELDGTSIGHLFKPVEKSTQYSYAILPVSEGYHSLRNKKGFIAHQYGQGRAVSYHILLGSSYQTKSIDIKDGENEVHPDSSLCINKEYLFHIDDTIEVKIIKWEIDDIPVHTGDSLLYIFDSKGSYTIKMILEYEDSLNAVNSVHDTITLTVNVTDYLVKTISETIREGEYYDFYGRFISSAGVYDTIIPSPVTCDTLVTLNLHVNQTLRINLEEIDEICADDENFKIRFNILNGELSHYSILFNNKAIEKGFVNIENNPMDTEPEIHIDIPENIIPDIYSCTIIFYRDAEYYLTFPVEFTIHYSSSIIAQRWNDVLAVKSPLINGGFDFTHYQWYQDDIILNEQTSSYAYIPEELDFESEYRVLLTRSADNVSVLTCPFIPIRLMVDLTLVNELDIAVFNKVLIVETEENTDAVIWNEMGIKMGDLKLKAGKNEFTLNYPPGMYILEILDFNGKPFYRRFIIR